MWLNENLIVSAAIFEQKWNVIHPVLSRALRDPLAPVPSFCPACGNALVRKNISHVQMTFYGCPLGHGLWISAEQARQLLAIRNIPVRVKTIQEKKWAVGVVILIWAGIIAFAYFNEHFAPKINARRAAAQISPSHWPPRAYHSWFPLPYKITGADEEEMKFWRQWQGIINQGITNRMNIQDALLAMHTPQEYFDLRRAYTDRQVMVIKQLADMHAPPRLQTFKDLVVSAGYSQMSFYEFYAKARAESSTQKFSDVRQHPDLVETDKKLWDAYHYFQSLYPKRDQAGNDAIERRLAWFDII